MAMASLSLISSSPSLALSRPSAHKCIPSPRPISCIAAHNPNPSHLGLSRRLALPLLGFSLFLSSSPALAIDVPVFGIRKRVEQAQKVVVEEVQELVKGSEKLVQESETLVKESETLVKGGQAEVSAVAGAVSTFVTSPVEPGGSLPPAYQAGAVAATELVAVLVASSVVNGLVSES